MSEASTAAAGAPQGRLARLVQIEGGEWPAVAVAALYFFSLLCGYYVVRPLRDEMGIAGGVEKLQWLFTATFVVMLAVVPLFGWVTSRFPRRRFLPYVYAFFALNLLVFWLLFRLGGVSHPWAARAFFVWASVYNLFVVSVFWSFMVDVFRPAQAKRLFGPIAAGGTAGAIAGPTLTATLAQPLGPANLLLVSAALLGVAIACVHVLGRWQVHRREPDEAAPAAEDAPMGGTLLAGLRLVTRSPYLLGICALMLLFTTLATFLYFEQAHIVEASFDDPAKRTTVFAAMDLAVNVLTLATQLFLTGRLVHRIGVGWTLALVPLALCIGFGALAVAPVLAVIVVVQVLRRAGNYAIMRPAREMLYTVLGREEKYKAKNFIDTAVYRGGDAVSAWAFAGLSAAGLGLGAIALVAVPLSLAWALIGLGLGRAQERRAAAARDDGGP